MKVLSVRNPNSYLLCLGIKDVENRSRPLGLAIGERIAIHSSDVDMDAITLDYLPKEIRRELKLVEYEDDTAIIPDDLIFKAQIEKLIDVSIKADSYTGNFFKSKAIIGEVTIADIIPKGVKYDSPFADVHSVKYVVTDPVLWDRPILYVKGKLGVWTYND